MGGGCGEDFQEGLDGGGAVKDANLMEVFRRLGEKKVPFLVEREHKDQPSKEQPLFMQGKKDSGFSL